MPETTPDTTAYLLLGLTAAFGLVMLLIASMVLRYRSLLKDEQTVSQLLQDENS